MKKIKLPVILMMVLLFVAMIPFAGAYHETILSTEIIDLGDGIVAEVITSEICSSSVLFSSSRIKEYHKTANVTSGSLYIGTFTLHGTFEYDGSSAEAIGDDYDTACASGYRASASSSHYGATVKGSCTFSGNGISKTVSLKMTCDKNGNIS